MAHTSCRQSPNLKKALIGVRASSCRECASTWVTHSGTVTQFPDRHPRLGMACAFSPAQTRRGLPAMDQGGTASETWFGCQRVRLMRHKHSEMMLSYWAGLRGTRGQAPRREDLSPRAFKRALPDVFLIERMDRHTFAFRLAGTRVCTIYGRELRDHNFISLWPATDQNAVKAVMERALKTATPAVFTAIVETLDRRQAEAEILLMPLADENGQVTRLLGSFVTVEALPAFSDFRIAVQALRRAALIEPSQAHDNDAGNNSGGGMHTQGREAFLSGRPTKVPYLRIVSSRADLADTEALGERLMRLLAEVTGFGGKVA